MDDREKAREILQAISHITLATVGEGKPWNTPVFSAFDDGFNIYWSSLPDAVHSKNIAATGDVFIAVFNSKAGSGEGTGVYIEAKAAPLEDEVDIVKALELLGSRRGRPFQFIEKFMGDSPRRVYKAVPQRMWLNDADKDKDGDFIRDYRIEIAVAKTDS